jgi:hypothetical protein
MTLNEFITRRDERWPVNFQDVWTEFEFSTIFGCRGMGVKRILWPCSRSEFAHILKLMLEHDWRFNFWTLSHVTFRMWLANKAAYNLSEVNFCSPTPFPWYNFLSFTNTQTQRSSTMTILDEETLITVVKVLRTKEPTLARAKFLKQLKEDNNWE